MAAYSRKRLRSGWTVDGVRYRQRRVRRRRGRGQVGERGRRRLRARLAIKSTRGMASTAKVRQRGEREESWETALLAGRCRLLGCLEGVPSRLGSNALAGWRMAGSSSLPWPAVNCGQALRCGRARTCGAGTSSGGEVVEVRLLYRGEPARGEVLGLWRGRRHQPTLSIHPSIHPSVYSMAWMDPRVAVRTAAMRGPWGLGGVALWPRGSGAVASYSCCSECYF